MPPGPTMVTMRTPGEPSIVQQLLRSSPRPTSVVNGAGMPSAEPEALAGVRARRVEAVGQEGGDIGDEKSASSAGVSKLRYELVSSPTDAVQQLVQPRIALGCRMLDVDQVRQRLDRRYSSSRPDTFSSGAIQP